MRHNKMAGNSKFLLGKSMPSEGLTTSRKRKPSTFTNNGNTKVNTVNNMLHSKSTYFYRWSYLIPSICGVALLIGLGLAFNPAANNSSVSKVYAETITSNPTYYSSISMTLSNNGTELDNEDTVSANVTPGLVSYIDNNIKISTSKIDRFYVTVQTAEDSTSSLTGTAHGGTIAPVEADTSVTSFGDNTWGYALGDTNTANVDFVYNPLPAYNTAITPQYSSAQNLQDGDYNLKLTFAAKINADKPSDHYTTKAMVSVAADAAKLTSMQDFAKAGSCNELAGEIRLRDDRDDKEYWVGKLADGNCWMTQNLDLDMKVARDGVIAATNVTDLSTWKTDGVVTNTTAAYYNPGIYVYGNNNNPIAANACTNTTDLSVCTSNGWISIPNDYTPYTTNDNAGKIVDTTAKKYDARYTIGNYYSWEAATNGTGSQAQNSSGENGMGAVASGSICPKGWKLPLAGANCADGSCDNDSKSGSFRKLLTSYGFNFGAEYNGQTSPGGISTTGLTSITGQHVAAAPFYFLRGGYLDSGQLYYAGNTSSYWSSVAYSATYAYYLFFNSTNLYSSNYSNRYLGRSVRCLVE